MLWHVVNPKNTLKFLLLEVHFEDLAYKTLFGLLTSAEKTTRLRMVEKPSTYKDDC